MIFNLRMKKIITLCSFSFTVMLFLLFGGTQSSCSKNTTCQVSILVTDTANVPVAGASVKLYANITQPGKCKPQELPIIQAMYNLHFNCLLFLIYRLQREPKSGQALFNYRWVARQHKRSSLSNFPFFQRIF